MRKAVAISLAFVLLFGFIFPSGMVGIAAQTEEETYGESADVIGETVGTDLFSAYYESHRNANRPQEKVEIDVLSPARYTGIVAPKVETVDGRRAIVTAEEGLVEWKFTVKEEGLYDVVTDYYPVEGKGSTIERVLYLDGKIPYNEARAVIFNRIWGNQQEEKIYTTSGNEYRRTQCEKPQWQTVPLISNIGYTSANLKLYLTAGEHTLALEATGETLALSGIQLCQLKELPSYQDYLTAAKADGAKIVSSDTATISVQGEDAILKSSSTLYAIGDKTSCITEPYSETNDYLNTIGGNNWKKTHQWLSWEVDVPKTGLYRFDMRCKQDLVSGGTAYRTLSVDDEIPFAEAQNLAFSYSLKWQVYTLKGKEPYLLYLTAGKHTVKLTATIDSRMSAILEDISLSVQEVNALSRKIKMITGSFPDKYRDYHLETNIPELRKVIQANIDRLKKAESNLVSLSGGKGEQSVYIDVVLVELQAFLDKPDTIPERVSALSDDMNALASWISSASQVPLVIDWMHFSAPKAATPKADANFFEKLLSFLKEFFYSFFVDYYSVDGFETGKADATVTLWLESGRDQATAIKTLADNYFTPKYHVALNVRLVAGDVLLRAVSSGTGPDVSIFQGQAKPVEYGLRGALYDLAQFEDIDEVVSRFSESAMVSQSFDGKIYGLPEQQSFLMMFVRDDIFKELGLKVPNTWDELYSLIPVLQENGMNIGLPSPTGVQSGALSTNLNTLYATILMQNGGSVYKKDGSRCALDTLTAVNCFIRWSEFYTKFNATKTYSPINRFRTGEFPIIFEPYSFYNSIVVAAPEINGLWSMKPVPGTVQADGTIDRTVPCTVTSVLLFKNAKNIEASWKFLKWWTSYEGQSLYANEIEALQGESARWPTANLQAMADIPWKTNISTEISKQWEWVRGIEEVPGSYIVGRTVDNAIKSVINSGESPRDTILDAADIINDEMKKKRIEFELE